MKTRSPCASALGGLYRRPRGLRVLGVSALVWLLSACGAGRGEELPPGVSTAPRRAPPPPVEEPDAGVEAPPPVTHTPAAPPRYLLRVRTGMSLSGKQNDPKKVIARIEESPGMLQTCAPYATREPNAPDGTWSVELTLKGKKSELDMQSPVGESFELCMQDAAQTWDLTGVGAGKLMLLFGLELEAAHEERAQE